MATLIGKLGPQDIIDGNVNSTDPQSEIQLSVLPNGNYVAVWTDGFNGNNAEIQARIFAPDGTLVDFLPNVNTFSHNQQTLPNVLGLADGNVLFVWDVDGVISVGRIYEPFSETFITGEVHIGDAIAWRAAITELANGNLIYVQGLEFKVFNSLLSLSAQYSFTSSPIATEVSVAALQNGNLVFTYDNGGDVAFSIVDPSNGNVLIDNQEITNTTSTPNNGTVVVLEDGNFVAVWVDSDAEIKAAIYDPNGNHIVTTQVVEFPSPLNSSANVAALSGGGFAVTWYGHDVNLGGIFARTFNSIGEPTSDAFGVNSITDSQQQGAVITGLTEDRFTVGWVDFSQPGDGSPLSVRTQSYYATEIASQYEMVTEGNSRIGNVLDGFTPPPGITVFISGVGGEQENVGVELEGAFGRLTIQADGSYSYIADTAAAFNLSSGHNGLDSFQINFEDQFGNTVSETLSFEVAGLDNYILGTSGNDNNLKGVIGVDIIMGEAGNDTIWSGPEDAISNLSDLMYGGTGDDIYNLLNENDQVIEFEGEGKDTVRIAKTYTLTPDVENLELLGTGNINGTGNESNNKITGNSGNNKLDGGIGADILAGGLGDDSYFIDNAGDFVDEKAVKGIDTVHSSLVNYTLTANVENLTLATGGVNGKGNAAGNYIKGNSGANELVGEGGNDTLEGGLGFDTLIGGAGDDIYYIIDGDVVDEIKEASGGGTDTVLTSQSNYTLAEGVENLSLIGFAKNATGNSLKNTINGGSDNDLINGGTDADKMVGWQGDDTYIVDNIGDTIIEADGEGKDTVKSSVTHTLANHVEILELTGTAVINGNGNALDNEIKGNSANNVLDGKAGADKMYGFNGDDTYVVDNLKDVVSESGAFFGSGIDLVQSSVNWTLGQNFENLTLTGTANLSGFGNSLNNKITGNSGNNTLNGGAGNDELAGGAGNDIYYVDSLLDVVKENLSAGTDTVFASVSGYTLTNNVENLTLTEKAEAGTGNSLNNTIVGNGSVNTLTGGAGNDTLDGGTSADTLIGGTGNDIYFVVVVLVQFNEVGNVVNVSVYSSASAYHLSANIENLFATNSIAFGLVGNNLANTIVGNSGSNLIVGATGNDTLTGKGGSDTFQFDPGFGKDKITDFSAGLAGDDVISFTGGLFGDFATMMTKTTQNYNGTIIALDSSNAILLMGVQKSSLHESDFLFA